MSQTKLMVVMTLVYLAFAVVRPSSAQDWPQWRGVHRDAKVTGFQAPETWPAELTQKWKVTVGEGVATPALVGNKLYVFSRQEGNEVTRCIHVETGEELWRDEYEAAPVRGPASAYSGPRSSPTVAEDKVVTLGVEGVLSCLDAATGKVVWRKDEYKGSVPRFATSSSAVVIDGLCIAQLGGEGNGVIAAYDLASGEEKWKWSGDSPAYASPMELVVGDTKAIIAATERNLVVLGAADGKVLWQVPYEQGRYNAATPIIRGQLVIYAGPTRGLTAEKIAPREHELAVEKVWANEETSVQFNTPVLKGDWLFGLSNLNSLFCVNAVTGQTAWSAAIGTGAERPPESKDRPAGEQGKRRRGGGGGGGYGSVVDAGDVLLALTPTGELIVYEPTEKEFKKLASYKLAEGKTYAYPIATGNRLIIKDEASVTLWTIP